MVIKKSLCTCFFFWYCNPSGGQRLSDHPVFMYSKGAFFNVMSEKFHSVNMHGINTVKIGVSDFFRCRVCHLSVTIVTQLRVYSLCKLLSFIGHDFDKRHFILDVGVLWFCPNIDCYIFTVYSVYMVVAFCPPYCMSYN
jgi:hypothetical protein